MNLKLKFLSNQYRANFAKEGLAFDGYNHTAWPDDDPRLTGNPDSILLNKSESYDGIFYQPLHDSQSLETEGNISEN